MKQYLSYFLCALLLTACGSANKLDKANRIFDEGAYAKAAKEYKGIVKKLPKGQSEDVYFRYAESYRKIGKYREAEAAYAALFRDQKTVENPEIYYRYGQILLANEKYDKAQEQFSRYKEQRPDDPQAETGLASVELAKQFAKEKTAYQVEPVAILNTTANDYAPAYGADDYETLLFTSTRKTDNVSNKIYDVTGDAYADIYFSRINRAGKWERPQNIGKEINTKQEDGAATFNSSYTMMYFTRCQKIKRENIGCKIFTAERNGNEWSEPKSLQIVPDSITAAHPSISDDDLTLYFASDLGEGMGKMDIWKVTRGGPNDEWGEPINVGVQINTQGNEMYPFIRNNGSLYFASDGHPGFGGLDIFKATLDSLENWVIENMGPPINSPADDFAIIFERDNERGYFSSRHKDKGSRGGDDIFRFSLDVKPIEYFFAGLVKDVKTGKVLENADIRLVGSNGASLRKRTETDGAFLFRVNAGLEYLAIASRDGYLNGKVRFSSGDWENGYTQRDTFLLTPTDKPIEIPNIFYEFGKATLTDASRSSLDSLVTIMKDNPSIVVALRAHTDSRGSVESNIDLSQRRAQSVVDYLIQNGIDEGRLEAVGLGESEPKTVDAAMAAQYKFLQVGQKLNDRLINALPNEEEQEICHQLNRRTEMQVIRNDYVTD